MGLDLIVAFYRSLSLQETKGSQSVLLIIVCWLHLNLYTCTLPRNEQDKKGCCRLFIYINNLKMRNISDNNFVGTSLKNQKWGQLILVLVCEKLWKGYSEFKVMIFLKNHLKLNKLWMSKT